MKSIYDTCMNYKYVYIYIHIYYKFINTYTYMKSLYSLYIYNETRTLGAQGPEGSNGVVCQKYVMSKPRIITAQLNC